MSYKVLLIEDAEETKDLVCRALGASFEVIWRDTLKSADAFIRDGECDLILLDVGLPDGDGFHFFSMMKNDGSHKVPVIFLTSHDSVSDKVMGITMGADDYIPKPFAAAELKARVESRIKKQTEVKQQSQIILKENLEINLAEQRVYFLESGRKTDLMLTPLEFKILVLLLSNEEHVFSRDQLLNRVWGENTYLSDRAIDSHVYTLRKKLGTMSSCVQSVYGEGYRFSIRDVESAPPSDAAAAGKKAA